MRETGGEASYARATQISNAEILRACTGFHYDNKIMRYFLLFVIKAKCCKQCFGQQQNIKSVFKTYSIDTVFTVRRTYCLYTNTYTENINTDNL